ncbi:MULTISPECIES: BT_3987 domain-containing protein [unclassified Carboxylicivirga]|uniref:BT_3987 domain-containing protein n=1 Tax=Carboxylicivirga TaxID=1628153 RepID=UPI003D3488BB
MKNLLYYTLTIFLLASAFGCKDNFDAEGMAPGVLSIATPGLKKIVSYDVGETYSEPIWISVGGLENGDSKVLFTIQPELLDSLNDFEGKNFEILPESCYSLSDEPVVIPAGESNVQINLEYYPEEILKYQAYGDEKFVLPIVMKELDGFSIVDGRNEMFLNFVVSEPKVRILNAGMYEIDVTADNLSSMDVALGVEFTNKWDIHINLNVSQELVDAYNTDNGTFYSLLPETMYTAPESIDLPNGTKEVIAAYQLHKDKIMPGNYMMPFKIASLESSLDGEPTDVIKIEEDDELYYTFSLMGDLLPKAAWTIESFTTQEPAEGQWGNGGLAIHLIDDNPRTFWHSAWAGGSDPLPYQITIDMAKECLISQIEVLPRGGSTNNPIYLLDFETSIDGQNWEFVGRFDFENTTEPLVYAVKATQARYIRMIVPDSGGNQTIAAIRELSAYGKEL